MNAKLQTFLSGLAKCAGLTIEFPDGAPVRISGFQDADPPFIVINADQPDSELIFAILKTIGLVPTQNRVGPIPWFVNRPYENEIAGEIAYKTRRLVRQKLNRKWHADLWALCVYAQMRCPNEFRDFLRRHPEKTPLVPLVLLYILKFRVARFFSAFSLKFPAGTHDQTRQPAFRVNPASVPLVRPFRRAKTHPSPSQTTGQRTEP